MDGMLAAEAAILAELQPVRIILLVFEGVVVPLLALCAGQRDFNAHNPYLLEFKRPCPCRSLKQIWLIKRKPLAG
jgi:hypothetical protein